MFLFTSITVLSSGTSCICSVDLEGIDSMKCFASWHFDCSSLYILQSSKAEQNFVVNCISYGKIRSGQQEWQMIRDRPNIIIYRWVHLWFTYVPSSSLIHLYSLYFWLCFFFFLFFNTYSLSLSLLPAPTFVVFSPVSHFPSFPLLFPVWFPASPCLSPSLRRFTELLSDIIISCQAAFSSLDMFDHKCSVAFSSSQFSSSFYHLAFSKFLWIFLRPPLPRYSRLWLFRSALLSRSSSVTYVEYRWKD